jgi:hypothetical protein
MAVNLFICPTLVASSTIAPAEFSDALAGGGSGLNLGQVSNGLYSPIVNQATNDGAQLVYLSHNATIDPITDVKVYINTFSQTYGGAVSAASDYTSIKNEGQLSTSNTGDKNNSNGTSSGLWVDFKWDVSQTNQFDIATRGTEVKIFGDNGTDGISVVSAFPMIAASAMYAANSSSEAVPSAAVSGKIGKSSGTGYAGDSVLGNRAKIRKRVYLRSAFPDGGIFQVDYIYRFSFSA